MIWLAIPLSFKVGALVGLGLLALEIIIGVAVFYKDNQNHVLGLKVNYSYRDIGAHTGLFNNWKDLPKYPCINCSIDPVADANLYFILSSPRCTFDLNRKTVCLEINQIRYKVSEDFYATPPWQCKAEDCELTATFQINAFKPSFSLTSSMVWDLIHMKTNFEAYNWTFTHKITENENFIMWYRPILLNLDGKLIYFDNNLKKSKIQISQFEIPLFYKQKPIGFYNIE